MIGRGSYGRVYKGKRERFFFFFDVFFLFVVRPPLISLTHV